MSYQEMQQEAAKQASDSVVSWAWPLFLDSYIPEGKLIGFLRLTDPWKDVTLSGKFMILQTVLKEADKLGEKTIVFTQSIPTLNLIESLLLKKQLGWKQDIDFYRYK